MASKSTSEFYLATRSSLKMICFTSSGMYCMYKAALSSASLSIQRLIVMLIGFFLLPFEGGGSVFSLFPDLSLFWERMLSTLALPCSKLIDIDELRLSIVSVFVLISNATKPCSRPVAALCTLEYEASRSSLEEDSSD